MITQDEIKKFSKLMENPTFSTFMSTYNLIKQTKQDINGYRESWTLVEIYLLKQGKARFELEARANILMHLLNVKTKYFIGDFFIEPFKVWFEDPEEAIVFKLKFA